jgi:hypothetical protein
MLSASLTYARAAPRLPSRMRSENSVGGRRRQRGVAWRRRQRCAPE